MATQRPGFARNDTDRDIATESPSPPTSAANDIKKNPDFKEEEEKNLDSNDYAPPQYYEDENEEGDKTQVVHTAKDIVTTIIDVDDDPTINPWTFRMFFLGIGLAIFGSVLQEIFYFKPQVIYVSVTFLTVIAYVLGELMALAIPRWGFFKYLNPGPFNLKEHAAISLMASAGAQSALATEALAAQALYYGGYPSKAAGVFITLSSQLIGFGIAGLLREVIVHPTAMLWPQNLPITTLLESLHRDKVVAKQRIKFFYIGFAILFVWEVFPEYIFPVLEGVSIFCLAKQDNLVFTNLFGGASGNEGLGFLSLCFDWQYIAGLGSPLWYPLYTLTNNFIGYIGCILLFMGIFYTNQWRSRDFPFLSQLLYTGASNGTFYDQFNQSLILNDQFEIDPAKLAQQGIPYLTGSYVGYLITTNMGITAVFTHMLLWNFDDVKLGWAWAAPRNLKKLLTAEFWQFWKNQETPDERLARKEMDPALDVHYKLMLRNKYPEIPHWWFAVILIASFVIGLAMLYVMHSTLPWWGFIIGFLLTTIFMLFFGAQFGITGFQFNIQPVCQMLAGYMFPGKPLANLYFTCYTFNALQQGQILARDMKLAQYIHLAPRCTFFTQVFGCIVGALFNYLMMLTIVDNQRDILLSIEGTNIWSGQNIQQFNTLAIAWSIASDMFSVGARYQMVTIAYLIGFFVPFPFWIANKIYPNRFWSYINLSIILWYMGWLFVGINASITSYFILGFGAQFWLRKYHAETFNKYNYILSAALDGGTQVLVFILTFAVFGGSGTAVSFPTWAGNPAYPHNLDYCMVDPALLS